MCAKDIQLDLNVIVYHRIHISHYAIAKMIMVTLVGKSFEREGERRERERKRERGGG